MTEENTSKSLVATELLVVGNDSWQGTCFEHKYSDVETFCQTVCDDETCGATCLKLSTQYDFAAPWVAYLQG